MTTADGQTRLRPAASGDLDAILLLERTGLGRDAWPRGLVEQGLAGTVPTVRYLVAESGPEVAAYAVASLVPDVAELQRIAVDPRFRRRGLATRLLDEVVALAVAEGAGRLLLEVREDNEGAVAFYRARGLAPIGRRRRYYADGADALVLERPIGGTA